MKRTFLGIALIGILGILTGCSNIGDNNDGTTVITFRVSLDGGNTWGSTNYGNGSIVSPGGYMFQVFLNDQVAPPWSVEQGGLVVASNRSTTGSIVEGQILVRVGDMTIWAQVQGPAPIPGVSLRLNGAITITNGGSFTGGTYEVSVLLDGVSQTSNWTVTSGTTTIADAGNTTGIFPRSSTFSVDLVGYNPITVYSNAVELTVSLSTVHEYTTSVINEATVDMATYSFQPKQSNIIPNGTWFVRAGSVTGTLVADNDPASTVTESYSVQDGECYLVIFPNGSTMRVHIQMSTTVQMVYDPTGQQVLVLLPLWVQSGLTSNVDIHSVTNVASFHATERLFPGTTSWCGASLVMWPEVYGGHYTTGGQDMFGRVCLIWGVAYPGAIYGFSLDGSATFNGASHSINVVRQTVATTP